jgi:prolyl oligopeptidase PreP (S9A serine peptidase family)
VPNGWWRVRETRAARLAHLRRQQRRPAGRGLALLQRRTCSAQWVCAVPVTDMLRFHKFTFGRFGCRDTAIPDIAADFRALHAYSPLHNVAAGGRYPPLLVTTADHDDRVVPAHAYKFVATCGRAPIRQTASCCASTGAPAMASASPPT